MKTFATFAAALTAVAGFAMAAPREQRSYSPCSGLYSTAQCCAVNVLGIADLDCANRTLLPLFASPSTLRGRETQAPLPTQLLASPACLPHDRASGRGGERLTKTRSVQPLRPQPARMTSRKSAPQLARRPVAACCLSWSRTCSARGRRASRPNEAGPVLYSPR